MRNIELSKFNPFPFQIWNSKYFHTLGWHFMKNIELSKFTHFLVQISDSSFFHTFWWHFMKNIELSKFIHFLVQISDSSYFHTLWWVFMKNIKLSKFNISYFRYEIQVIFIHCDENSWKILNFKSSPISDISFKWFSYTLMRIREKY